MARRRDTEEQVEDELRTLVEELCVTINESLNGSERITAVIDELHARGFDLTLLLEATLQVSQDKQPLQQQLAAKKRSTGRGPALRLTSSDRKYLKDLKIAMGSRRGTGKSSSGRSA